MNLTVVTNSALSSARACLRLYRNRYVLRLRALRESVDTTELGDLVHVGLEAWWLGAGDARAVAAIQAVRAHAKARGIDDFQLARAEAMLLGYHARWADEAERYEVVGVELEFSAPLVNPATEAESRSFRIAGKIDVVVREIATGRVLIVEHKTSSEDISDGSFYWVRRHMDGQVSIYYAGAAALGHDVQGCIYDVLGKPELRPSAVPLTDELGEKVVHDGAGQRVRTKDGKRWRQTGDTALGYVVQTRPETPGEFRARLLEKLEQDLDGFYQRKEVARDGTDLVDAARDRWQQALILRDAHRTGTWPRNPDACLNYGRPCEFLEACAGRADLADPYLFRRLESAHVELSAAAVAAPTPSREETAA
jgi:hypothetical protein